MLLLLLLLFALYPDAIAAGVVARRLEDGVLLVNVAL